MKERVYICLHINPITMKHTHTAPRRQRIHTGNTVRQQLSADVRAFVRAGAMDSEQSETAAVRALATLRKLTMHQAERVWVAETVPQGWPASEALEDRHFALVRATIAANYTEIVARETMPASLRNS
jgi:hypothetical protein